MMQPAYLITFWSPSAPPTSHGFCMEYFKRELAPFGNIQCLHLSDNRDKRTLQLLRQSDLVVVLLRQNYGQLCRLFCFDSLRFANYLYIITEYVPHPTLDLKHISFEFRIPAQRICAIPYTPRVQHNRELQQALFFALRQMLLALGL